MAITLTAQQRKALSASFKSALPGSMSIKASSYQAPTVKPVSRFGVLEPDVGNTVNETYIVIDPAPPASYLVAFYWDGDESMEAEGSIGAPIQAKVPPALVIAAANRIITVIYSVLDPAGEDWSASAPLTLKVGAMPVYPAPVITQAKDGVLDVKALTADAGLTLAAWPNQTVGQKLWLTLTSDPVITLANKWRPVTVENLGPLTRNLARAQLQKLTHGSTLTLTLETGPDEQHLSPFSQESYTIKAQQDVKAVAITSVKDSKGAEIPNNGSTTDTSITVSGTVTYAT